MKVVVWWWKSLANGYAVYFMVFSVKWIGDNSPKRPKIPRDDPSSLLKLHCSITLYQHISLRFDKNSLNVSGHCFQQISNHSPTMELKYFLSICIHWALCRARVSMIIDLEREKKSIYHFLYAHRIRTMRFWGDDIYIISRTEAVTMETLDCTVSRIVLQGAHALEY